MNLGEGYPVSHVCRVLVVAQEPGYLAKYTLHAQTTLRQALITPPPSVQKFRIACRRQRINGNPVHEDGSLALQSKEPCLIYESTISLIHRIPSGILSAITRVLNGR